MSILDADALLGDFEDEARAHIAGIEAAFLDVGALAANPSGMDGVFRAAHSLKGTAGFFSFGKIVAVAHALENVFARIRDGSLEAGEEISDTVLAAVDCLKALVGDLQAQHKVETATVLAALGRFGGAPAAGAPEIGPPKADIPFDMAAPDIKNALAAAAKRGHKAFWVHISIEAGLGKYKGRPEALAGDLLSVGGIVAATAGGEALAVAGAAQLISALAGVEKGTGPVELLLTSILEPELFLVAVELEPGAVHVATQATAAEKEREPARKEKPELSIRMDIKTVNGLMDLANELILTRNRLLASLEGHAMAQPGLASVLQDMNRLTGDIQEKIIRARMQPLGGLFGKFPRIIHDIARALGKDIHLEVAGGDIKLDKYLLDSLSDPIAQLVNNAADHGIEAPERRRALGKPEQGVVTLCAYIYDGKAVIEITDDGAGLDFSALMAKAIERGAVPKERLALLTRAEIAALAFLPGVSTATRLTNVSGRGVGMDIVKTNIERLGGTIEIDSEQGAGTTIRIKMPQTLSAAGTLIIKENGILYGVPEGNVEHIARVAASNPARRLDMVNGSLMLGFDGQLMPVVSLAAAEAKDKGGTPPGAAAIAKRLSAGVLKCLVLKTGDKNFALLIEDAVAAVQALVSPLPLYLRGCRCYSGVTVLGSGDAIAILDAAGIKRLAGVEGSPRVEPPEVKPVRAGGQAIVFKGSEGLFALNAQDVARIERISPAGIREIGERRFVDIAGRAVRVLCPEDYAPVERREYPGERLYLVTLGGEGPPAGFLAGKVLDRVACAYTAASGDIGGKYVLGAGAYGSRTVIYLDTAAILRSLAGAAGRPYKDGDGNESAVLFRRRRMVRRRYRDSGQGGA
jgi:two-component system chemotaxis sensor kinase CheA